VKGSPSTLTGLPGLGWLTEENAWGVTLTMEQLLVLSGPPGRGLCADNPEFVALPSRMNPLHLSIRRS
jgi:hypothetical protein